MNLRILSGLLSALLALPAAAVLPTVQPAVQPTVAASESIPTLGAGALLQTGIGLLAVLALIFLCAWAARRFGLQRHAGNRLIKVVASTMVGQRERIVVVEIGASWLVLGVTPGQINSLHTLPAENLPTDPAAASTTAANAFSHKLRESISKLRRSN